MNRENQRSDIYGKIPFTIKPHLFAQYMNIYPGVNVIKLFYVLLAVQKNYLECFPCNNFKSY
jgi:hypothetical protein